MIYQGQEVLFERDELIVSKTDLTGKLTYTNRIFLEIAGYSENEVIGKQHNVIRHPNMPRVIFELLWETISSGSEIFAYVVNSTKNGDYYWVLAHVTPSIVDGETVGYHSTRRVPNPQTIKNVIEPLYEKLKQVEDNCSSKKQGIVEAREVLNSILEEKQQSYDEFIASLVGDD